jgi:hypothetical protein
MSDNYNQLLQSDVILNTDFGTLNGATTFSIATLVITKLSIMTFRITINKS